MAVLSRVAVLALTLNLALAEPGSLRGAGQNKTDNATDGVAEAVAANSTPPDAEGTGHLLERGPQAANASAIAEFAGNATEPMLGSGASYYWDGQCTPCPAYFYGHCSRGGVLAWSRPCGPPFYLGCEGLCSDSAPAGQPTNVQTPGTMTLYHMTSPDIAEKILSTGFRPGRDGWCGGAIYFYWSPDVPQTKLGPDSHNGAVIEAKVNMGKMAVMDNRCYGWETAKNQYDSLTFNPGDGDEYIVYSKDRILSMKRYS